MENVSQSLEFDIRGEVCLLTSTHLDLYYSIENCDRQRMNMQNARDPPLCMYRT